jgi:sporulation protein YlmC with PRC-barrel domain
MNVVPKIVPLAIGFALVGAAIAQQSQQPSQPSTQTPSQSQSQQPSQPSSSTGASQDKSSTSQDKSSTGASQDKSSSGKSGQSSTGASKDAPAAGVVPLGLTVEETAVVLKGWRASKLLHADVYNDENKKIGKIEDMIVSPDGKVSVAVIDVGGFLGVGKHRVAIPVDQFSDINAKKLVLPKATKETLKAMPEFRYA